jgi:hypothetical protein
MPFHVGGVIEEKSPCKMGEIFPMFTRMEQFISEIEAYAARVGRSPQSVLRSAINANWSTWGAWVSGASSPTMHVADRVRTYMAEHADRRAA